MRWLKRIRHELHYRWNQSRFNPDFNVWISDCACCCIKCEED
jgi:hypothetical protein